MDLKAAPTMKSATTVVERRACRADRRSGQDKTFEKLLRDFGLDRRSGADRRAL